MAISLARSNAIIKHVWTEPRFVAEMEWHREYGISAQLMRQVPRENLEAYAATGQHPDPDLTVSLVIHDPPDFDWWEPTSQWRRMAARDRGESR